MYATQFTKQIVSLVIFLGVFNLCQHFEISYSKNAIKPITIGVYITINHNYRWIYTWWVSQWLATCRWFSLGIPVSSTDKTDHHNITEILLKVVLDTINQPIPDDVGHGDLIVKQCLHILPNLSVWANAYTVVTLDSVYQSFTVCHNWQCI